jgi:uncharacterized protein (TIGR03000 family)
MYSLVLMTAMTAGAADAPAFFPRLWAPMNVPATGCYGCWGIKNTWGRTGASYGWCTGSCYGTGSGGAGAANCGSGSGWATASSPALWGANYTYTHSYPGQPPTTMPRSLNEQLPAPRKAETMIPSDTSARLALEVPADARLYVDGQLVPGAGTKRYFFTPPLETGATYYYEVKVEVDASGHTVSDMKKVYVKAGELKAESFAHIGAPAAPALAATK